MNIFVKSIINAAILCAIGFGAMNAASAEPPTGNFFQPERNRNADGYSAGDYLHGVIVDKDADSDSVLTLVGGCMWGGMRDVAISGNYAYAVMHHGFGVFDISNPAFPDFVAFLYIRFMWSWNIDIAGDYAYVVDYDGLKIIDIFHPESPYIIGKMDTPGSAYDIAVQGNYAYIAERSGGLQIIDISIPGSPSLAGAHATASSARGVAVQDTLAFIADYLGGLRIFDVSDPYAPTPLGYLDTIGKAYDVVVLDTIAYVACDVDGLRIVDVSDPLNPELITTYTGSVEAENIVGDGNYIYISDYNTGLEVVDITNPFIPGFRGSLDTIGEVCDIGNHLYMISNGLLLIDVGDPENPTVMGGYDTPTFGYDMKIIGNYAYGVSSDLNVVDISDPQAPYRIGSAADANSYSLAIVDTLAYAIGIDSTLKIFSVAAPEAPYLIQTLDSVGYAYDIATDGMYAYVPTWQDGLVVIDVSDPFNPSVIANHYDFASREQMFLEGDLLYISGLYIVNVADPLNPYEEGWYWGGGTAPGDLVVIDTTVYIAGGDSELMIGWLEIGSVADPTAPYHIGSLSTSNELFDVAVLGNYAFAVDYASLLVFDISDPAQPVYMTGFSGPGFSRVDADQNYIYVASQYGFLIFAMETNCGDVDSDGQISVGDVVYLINYIFKGGDEPQPEPCIGDANGDGTINIGDAIYLIDHIFRDGPPPAETCCD